MWHILGKIHRLTRTRTSINLKVNFFFFTVSAAGGRFVVPNEKDWQQFLGKKKSV